MLRLGGGVTDGDGPPSSTLYSHLYFLSPARPSLHSREERGEATCPLSFLFSPFSLPSSSLPPSHALVLSTLDVSILRIIVSVREIVVIVVCEV